MQPAIERAFEEHAEKLARFKRHFDHNRPPVNWIAPPTVGPESPGEKWPVNRIMTNLLTVALSEGVE